MKTAGNRTCIITFWHSDFELQAKSANEHFSYVLVNQNSKSNVFIDFEITSKSIKRVT